MASASSTIPVGYKQTEVGVIPEEWGTISLEETTTIGGLVRGPFGGALKKSIFVPRGFKVYEQKNAIRQSVEIGEYFIDSKKFNEMKRFQIEDGDFILSCSGTIGRIFQIPNNSPPGVINQALLKITINENIVNSDYFIAVFRSPSFQDRILDNTHGGAMPNLVGMPIFKNTKFQIPSERTEQDSIAEALSDSDSQIQVLEKLITKKRDIKQGTMQELLTGKTRLPGFSGEWRSKELSDLCRTFTGLTGFAYGDTIKPSLSRVKHSDYIPFIQNKDFDGLFTDYDTTFFIPLSIAKEFKPILLDGSCLLISKSGSIGKVGIYSNQEVSLIGGAIAVGKLWKNVVPEWVMYFLQSYLGQKMIIENLKAGSHQNLTVEDLRNLQIPIPDYQEQEAIAEVLSDMDAEIAALEQRLVKTKAIKQGMMQQLLTGRIRLVDPSTPVEASA